MELVRYVITNIDKKKISSSYITDNLQIRKVDKSDVKRTIKNYIDKSCEVSFRFDIDKAPVFYTEKSNPHAALVKLDDALDTILSCKEIHTI